jgi:hypothetical protein
MSTQYGCTDGQMQKIKNQIRSDSGLCGGENEVKKSVEIDGKGFTAELGFKRAPSRTNGADMAFALKSASGE